MPGSGTRRTWLWALGLAAAGAGLTLALYLLVRPRGDTDALELLRAPRAEQRSLGAVLAAKNGDRPALAYIARQLADSRESEPRVRASYAYALGRGGRAEHFDPLAMTLAREPDERVRGAAWLAAAQLDPRRFRDLASPPASGWERLGLARAWLALGDVRGVPALLDLAQTGDAEQRQSACAALEAGLAPLLEAAGRWPLGTTPSAGAPWPAELVADVQRRCAGLPLQAIADRAAPQAAAAAPLRRDVGRMTSARNRVARFLARF